jgi:6-phosphofructokinase 1
MKRIGVFTSGGDSPGMNAAIRAVTRTALHHGLEVFGIYRGYDGLIANDMVQLHSHSVSNIIQRGGTILKTARSMEFLTEEGMERAYQSLKTHGIDGLVAIGGDGTFRGAQEFGERYNFRIIGLPGTIDNDLFGTDFTIGFDTAVNTVVEAVDKIRDTADSHNRLFFIEVMGRDAGFIALYSGIATGAEEILIPETQTSIDNLVDKIRRDWRPSKRSSIIIVSEGDEEGGAYEVAKKVTGKLEGFSYRVAILGHIQRGGSPTCNDRLLASRLGHSAVEALLEGKHGCMMGIINNEPAITPFSKAVKQHNHVSSNLLSMAHTLSH